MREGRLRWFGHVKIRPQSAPVRRVESLTVDEARRRGRPKLRWEDRLKTDLKEMLLSEDMTSDRIAWRTRIRVLLSAFLAFSAALCSLLCSSVALLNWLVRPSPYLCLIVLLLLCPYLKSGFDFLGFLSLGADFIFPSNQAHILILGVYRLNSWFWFVVNGGKRDGNKPGANPLKVNTGTSMNSAFVAGNCSSQPNGGSKTDVDSGMNGADRQHDGMHRLPSFASLLHEEYSQRKVNYRILETEQAMADVLIHMSSVLEVHARFGYTLYGYSLGKKVAFLVVERYILNSLKKYGVKRVMGAKNGFFFIQFLVLPWTPSSKLTKEELTFVYVWIKFHGVPVSAFTADGFSALTTRLGAPVMLDWCTTTTCMQSLGRMNYTRALIDVRADRALKDTMVIFIPNPNGNGCPKRVMADLRKQRGTSNDALEANNEKPMDDLIDDTQKKMKAPHKKAPKTGRKANSLKGNVVFSPETKVNYFDREDMDFDDM
ncbi:zinc knuckle CX2CX4HX4C containing protein [Tanacetum coccineum]